MECLADVSCPSSVSPISTSSSDMHSPSSSDDHSISSEEANIILWRKFDGLPAIPGMFKNVVALFRESFGVETGSSEDKKYCLIEDSVKKDEKMVTVEVCKYLADNGVEKIEVASNFAEYAKAVGKELHIKKDDWGGSLTVKQKRSPISDSTDVTVVLLLECCGRWQQKYMFQLVRDSYYASRLGVVIIGTNSILKDELVDPAWKEYVVHLWNQDAIKDYLQLYCNKHKVSRTDIRTGYDLQTKCYSGGCGRKCGRMRCGHVCPYLCHPTDAYHKAVEFRCKQVCKKRCPFGHKCKRFCWDHCGICFEIVKINPCQHRRQDTLVYCHEQLCLTPVKKTLRCGHIAEIGCSVSNARKKGAIKNYQCQEMVQGVFKCGHKFMYRCSNETKYFRCGMSTLKIFKCGHEAILPCQEMRTAVECCGEICQVKLQCGHECGRPCHLEDPDHDKVKCLKLCKGHCSRNAHPCAGGREHGCTEPCPPCMEEYEYALECGHSYKTRCSDKGFDESNFVCKGKCMRSYAFCGHECKKMCGEDCGICTAVIDKIAPNCPRKHFSRVKCQEVVPSKCEFWVPPSITPDCGHDILVCCYEADTLSNMDLAGRCEAWCHSILDGKNECGHPCQGTCKDCFQGRYHIRCDEPCGKILICGHTCTSPCGMVCPPCRYVCMNYCEHGQCEYECGVPCERKCQEACPYMCEHSKCSKLCSEVCNKEICYEACKKILNCGHTCVGFCGEECPPYCRVCSPKELLRGIFNGNTEVGANDRFIYLKECGHCVESEAMEGWLRVKSDEVLPKLCPVCRSRITWIRRYSEIMNENLEHINSVRVKIFGKIDDIEDAIQLTIDMVETFDKAFVFPEFVEYIISTADVPIWEAPKLEAGLQSMSLGKANFLKMICHEWMNVSRIVWEYHEKLLPRHYDVFIKYWQEYMYDMIAERPWPLHPNEIGALEKERGRMEDVLALYSRVATNQSEEIKRLNASTVGSKLFQDAEEILQLCKPYSDGMKAKFNQRLSKLDGVLQCTIQLSETERVEIVRAFGDASGRWFKCERGHVYVVTECGGAIEIGKCNECGGSIGGEDHMLVHQNYLATEMDGADQPLYPTVLTRK